MPTDIGGNYTFTLKFNNWMLVYFKLLILYRRDRSTWVSCSLDWPCKHKAPTHTFQANIRTLFFLLQDNIFKKKDKLQ